MNWMIIGSGGREHALAWKLRQSSLVTQLFCAPGNAGTAEEGENVALDPMDFSGIIGFCRKNQVDMVVVGPEQPLCAGISDRLSQQGIKVFGPSLNAARLEGSKIFCKHLLWTANVPTADYRSFADLDEAQRYIRDRYPDEFRAVRVVVKADGLAAGKGAIVCANRSEALAAIDVLMRQKQFGDAASRIIIEDRLVGEEVSVMAITDGRTIVTLPTVQDHKRALDGDRGKNTGGMGAYSPAPIVDEETMAWIEQRVLIPTVHAMNRARSRFRGVLYAGLMLTPQGPRVLEFNVRFGDPECQTLLMRMKSDLAELLLATAEGRLSEVSPPVWDDRASVCVVMASEGYPDEYQTGYEIRGIDEAAEVFDTKVFHSGTTRKQAVNSDGNKSGGKARTANNESGKLVTAGGRVLSVTALGDSVAQAKLRAYQAIKPIRWTGAWCRKDIADRAITAATAEAAQATE